MLVDPYKAFTRTPVVPSITPLAGVVTATLLYTVPGGVDTLFNVKISNLYQGGDAHFWVGLGTVAVQPTNWLENGSLIPDGTALTLEEELVWIPPNTSIWVKSDTGSVAFTVYGQEHIVGPRP
jgi:hypothetical protein